jgi:hypothetical protein
LEAGGGTVATTLVEEAVETDATTILEEEGGTETNTLVRGGGWTVASTFVKGGGGTVATTVEGRGADPTTLVEEVEGTVVIGGGGTVTTTLVGGGFGLKLKASTLTGETTETLLAFDMLCLKISSACMTSVACLLQASFFFSSFLSAFT